MNNQGTSSPRFRRGVELVREGAIGDVSDVHLWFSRGGQNHREAPKGEFAIPDGLHWDLWLGPVAARPYHPKWIARCHWRETGAGELGNFGPHTMNLPFMALNVRELWTSPGAPIRVSAECSERNELSFPRWEIMRWRVPARGAMPPVTFHWHHGPVPGLPPDSREKLADILRGLGVSKELEEKIFKGPGALLLGTKGALWTSSHNTDILLLPEERFRDVDQLRPKTLPLSKGHAQDWIHACRGGEAPLSSFAHAATFGEFLMLGPVATRMEREFAYDPIAGKTDSQDADRLLGYEYRAALDFFSAGTTICVDSRPRRTSPGWGLPRRKHALRVTHLRARGPDRRARDREGGPVHRRLARLPWTAPEGRRLRRRSSAARSRHRNRRPRRGGPPPGPGRSVRRYEGAARGRRPSRSAFARRRPRMGGALPGRGLRGRGGPPRSHGSLGRRRV
jgi:hypothetical protein